MKECLELILTHPIASFVVLAGLASVVYAIRGIKSE